MKPGAEYPKGKAIEFKMGDRVYKIVEEENTGFSYEDRYCELTLFLNGQKLFGIRETVYSDQWSTTYKPISVSAYASDEWVDDFKKIKLHGQLASKRAEIEFAEDPKRTQRLKDDFGIIEVPKESTEKTLGRTSSTKSRPRWNAPALIAVIAYFIYALMGGGNSNSILATAFGLVGGINSILAIYYAIRNHKKTANKLPLRPRRPAGIFLLLEEREARGGFAFDPAFGDLVSGVLDFRAPDFGRQLMTCIRR